MKASVLIIFFALIVSLLGQPPQSMEVLETKKVELIVEPKATPYKQGSPIELHLHLRSLAKEPISFVRSGPMYDYILLVGDGAKEARKTEMGRGLFSTYVPLSSRIENLDPGAEWAEVLDVAMLYDLPAGTYKAYVSRNLKPSETDRNLNRIERVASGVFTFTVVP